MKKETIISTVLWAALSLGALFIPLRPFLGGAQLPFTAFEFVGPLAGVFVAPLAGAIGALLAKEAGFAMMGTAVTAFGLARLITPSFAAIYLGTKSKWILLVPLMAIIGFLLKPVGQQAPYITLLWALPIVLWPLRKFFYARALGATLTTHAVGGLLTVWLLPTSAKFWLALPLIALAERLMFALGLTLTYVVIKEASTKLAARWPTIKVLTPALK
jgi:hypothetical protein